MSGAELDAAGIRNPSLRRSYEHCRRLNAASGRTYYLATRLLPAHKRPYVHALYGFARQADEYVDSRTDPRPHELHNWGRQILADLSRGSSTDPVGAALVHTASTWQLPPQHFEAFLTSMAMDITPTAYATFEDLCRYMYGSAAVIGLQMVPILEPLDEDAYPHARLLGEAFQLTNFLRDIGEDLDRGRVYLPQEDLDRFGVSPADLEARRLTPAIEALLRFEIDRTRALYAQAEPGIGLLHPTSRDCIRTAFTLYGGILDRIERAGYDVLASRVRVPLPARLRVALPALARARRARRVERSWQTPEQTSGQESTQEAGRPGGD